MTPTRLLPVAWTVKVIVSPRAAVARLASTVTTSETGGSVVCRQPPVRIRAANSQRVMPHLTARMTRRLSAEELDQVPGVVADDRVRPLGRAFRIGPEGDLDAASPDGSDGPIEVVDDQSCLEVAVDVETPTHAGCCRT